MIRPPLCDLRRAVEEQRELRGRRIDNIFQTSPTAFLFRLVPGKIPLVIDVGAGAARVLVAGRAPAVPSRPPVFCTLLRNELRKGRLLGTLLLGTDRIVAVDVQTHGGPRRLVAEIFMRRGNLLLLDEHGTVLRVLDGDAAAHRGNRVGDPYRLPPTPDIPDEPSLLPADLPAEPFAANLALDALLEQEAGKRQQETAARDRARAVARLRKKRKALVRELEAVPDPDALRAQGNRLLEHFGAIRRGLADFRGIPLDPAKSPQENVDLLFRRARKAERARPILEARVGALEGRIEDFEQGREDPPHARRKPSGSRRAARQPTRLPYRSFRSADGLQILVGRGGADNDELTRRAGPHDLFLHVNATPGAHVIVPLPKGRPVPQETLLDAATLALHYSKLKGARRAEIVYAPRKHVRKPRKAPPGLVHVDRGTTLALRFEAARLERLLQTAGSQE